MARGPKGPLPREVQVSKKLSKLLRHDAEKEGLHLGPGGYINMKDVLDNRNLRSLKVTFAEVQQIVSDNDKQRFSLIHKSTAPSESSDATAPADDAATSVAADIPQATQQNMSNDPADYLIRANQGHSIAVESESLLTPITENNMPDTVVHGTTHAAWPLIVSTGGLRRMGRTHVHFASGLPAGFKSITEAESTSQADSEAAKEKPPVISGMRNSSSVLVFLDIKKAVSAGLNFWLSDNGVILSEGDSEGVISIQFFSKVEDRTGGLGVIAQDGVVIKEAPESWASKGGGKRSGRGGRGGQRGGRPGHAEKTPEAQE